MGICIGTIGSSGTLTTTAGGINLYFNSVSMTGSMGSGSTSALTTAIYIGSGASALDLRDNIFSNTQIGTSTTQKNYAIYSAAANTAFSNINYDDYFVSNSFNAGSALLGFLTSDRANLAAWQTATGKDANSVSGNPQFVSNTDLHINPSIATLVESGGTPIAGITIDIDGDTRNATTPDIGADEGNFTQVVTNDIQATAFISPTNGGSVIAGASFSPQASFTNNGTATQTSVTVRYRICTDGTCTTELYNQTSIIGSIASGVTTTVTFPSTSLSAGSYVIRAKAELAGDQVPGNDEISGTVTAASPLSGGYTVGAAGNYPTLTQAVNALNSLGISGPVTLTLLDSAIPRCRAIPAKCSRL